MTTTSQEATIALDLADECYQPETLDELRQHFETIRRALTMLARVEAGSVKVLAREPTEAMLVCEAKTNIGGVGIVSGYLDDFSANYIFEGMWDAAPPISSQDDLAEGEGK